MSSPAQEQDPAIADKRARQLAEEADSASQMRDLLLPPQGGDKPLSSAQKRAEEMKRVGNEDDIFGAGTREGTPLRERLQAAKDRETQEENLVGMELTLRGMPGGDTGSESDLSELAEGA